MYTPGMIETGAISEQGGGTVLHTAARHGQEGVCRALITHSADTTARDRQGLAPFHLALLYGMCKG